MANQVLVSIYGKNGNAIGTSAGTPHGFPSQGIVVEPTIS